MDKQKIFLCYTLKGADLTSLLLERFKRRMQATGLFEVYVDILDNTDKKNPQRYVMERLHDADLFCIIRSQMIGHSEWVRRELDTAESRGLPKVALTVMQIIRLLNTKSDAAFLTDLRNFFLLPYPVEELSKAQGRANHATILLA